VCKTVALIGPTASGKSAAGVRAAKECKAVILSLDSLAIYKQIDIASAKPTLNERGGIIHFGIDELYPDEDFDVTTYISLYKKAFDYAKAHEKNLLILGGTSFYLDILLKGVSQLPQISKQSQQQAQAVLQNLEAAYERYLLLEKSPKIAKNDRYRLQKWFEFWFETAQSKESYFKNNPPTPVINEAIAIYEIAVEKETLRQRIDIRTKQMFENGLVQEIESLLQSYGKSPRCFKAIGIKEVIEYIENKHTLDETIKLVATHTKQLAKRQRTFNRSKFPQKIALELEQIEDALIREFLS
jgi:tRNA dimethylallyltransferase